MPLSTILALLAASFIGVLYWWAIAIISTQTEAIRKIVGNGEMKRRPIMAALTNLVATVAVVAPIAVLVWKAATS